ncbi:hypothetical protein FO519_003352 [Halicephalobus sp. NKZ332]|nr:hypothetical protein FO519_003352 [Halicephalobus sp. NKZ332]
MKVVLLFLFGLVFVKATVDSGITTRSVEAAGSFKCGLAPASGVKLILKREDTEDLNDIIGKGETDSDGKFRISGNTERFGGAQSTIDPVLIKAFETFKFRFPRSYTSIGKIARRQYDIGKINLQVKYPGQKEEKNPPA